MRRHNVVVPEGITIKRDGNRYYWRERERKRKQQEADDFWDRYRN